ncbi:caspase family protein [Sphaerochaeta sp. S2]|uniref:caspase family protein n=1 Tax=Sphaerochaeta sp. S2 TaxID=2798868 RepID=UPI0018EA1CB7|nr:caspase family protein [Sphaerochaeta sp. S2]MBJ2355557.1 caspase family protein [Sphaerochaeta sp. S2]
MKLHLLILLSLSLFWGCELMSDPPEEGKTHHLAIALSYDGTNIREEDYLDGTLPDAIELEKAFDALFAGKEHTSTLMLQDGSDSLSDPLLPTKTHVIERIESLSDAMDVQDILIISYSGHGMEDGSLVLYPPRDDGSIFSTSGSMYTDVLLTVAELYDALDSAKGSVLLLLDSCYSGNFVQKSETSYSLIERNAYLQEIYDQYFTEGSYTRPVFVLAATTYDNTAGETSSHGYFTQALLEGMGWDEENQELRDVGQTISADYLYQYVYYHQGIKLNGVNSWEYQHPTITGGPLDLILR